MPKASATRASSEPVSEVRSPFDPPPGPATEAVVVTAEESPAAPFTSVDMTQTPPRGAGGWEEDPARIGERSPRSEAAPVRDATQIRHPFDEVCETALWRGYFKAAFYAWLLEEDEPLQAIAQSPFFRHRSHDLPEPSGQALAAYEALNEQLEKTGWSRIGTGRLWFMERFGR